MFKSVLVANRAEIACRIFRTARVMGIRTIAVYSDADAKAKHVREADEAIHIGAAPAAESYLRGDKIIDAARKTGAEAIHPGYGFLSENPDFAQAVIDAGLVWIGPTPEAIRAMGLKDEAKRIAEEAGVPVVPGYRGDAQDTKTLAKAAKEVGFPVLIKAIAGGGGRGIREVNSNADFADALASAQREAAAAFGDDRVIVEKLIHRPRHIEVQVFGDKYGNVVHLFERDCSLQRRRQKVIEEAPAPGMTEEVRAAMTEAALKVARAVNYENAGTVEYVVDGSGPLRPDGFWFLEMNTRLQVEHPVTEAVTGLDLVEWQFRVAAGEELPKKQDEIELAGCAIEARICAEEPSEGFRPSIGRITRFEGGGQAPRLDSGFEQGDSISSSYDSLIAKLIVPAQEREWAINAAIYDLNQLILEGVHANIAFLVKCLQCRAFKEGALHTGLIADDLDALVDRAENRRFAAACAALWSETPEPPQAPTSPWDVSDGFRTAAAPRRQWRFEDELGELEVRIVRRSPAHAIVSVNGVALDFAGVSASGTKGHKQLFGADGEAEHWIANITESSESVTVHVHGDAFTFQFPGASREHADASGGDHVKAPLPGKVVAISAKTGATVRKGEPLVTLEAMKMEHALKAPRDGVIAEVAVAAGAQVKEGALLVRLEEEAA